MRDFPLKLAPEVDRTTGYTTQRYGRHTATADTLLQIHRYGHTLLWTHWYGNTNTGILFDSGDLLTRPKRAWKAILIFMSLARGDFVM